MPPTVSSGLVGAVEHLRCPHCAQPLAVDDATDAAALRCPRGHGFDVARSGYVSLLAPRANTGTADTAAMVAARETVLRAGHLDGVTALLRAAAACLGDGVPGCVVDLGAGTGHHLASVIEALPGRQGVALDVSVPAARRAARAHPRIGAVVCDVWQPLPVRTATAALVLDVFAPRVGAEARRVLRPGGSLLVVTPTPRHLADLVGELGLLSVDGRKSERLAATLGPHLAFTEEQGYDGELAIPRADAAAIAAMGPSAHHLDPDRLRERVATLPPLVDITVSVTLTVWRRH